MLSRVIGGLSEGNVQLAKFVNVLTGFLSSNACRSSAIISDVTLPDQRSKALSSVGIAFAICFCIGPPIGAYFAARPLPSSIRTLGVELNVYAFPALLTLLLLLLETAYVAVALPETRGLSAHQNVSGSGNTRKKRTLDDTDRRLYRLKVARWFHFIFLSVFSGVEFTLTFLTYDRKPFLIPSIIYDDLSWQSSTGATRKTAPL